MPRVRTVQNVAKSAAYSTLHVWRQHWLLYIYEGAELAIFMISACVFSVLLFATGSNMAHYIPQAAWLRLLMGLAMGATAVGIIHSPMGKRSGAHFNPAITLTYLRLGKIRPADACGYVVGQFAGGIFGVAVSVLIIGSKLAQAPVQYAITVPGKYGTAAAFGAELFMATLLMGVVLYTTNRPALAKYASYMVGILITFYILLFAPVSGFSINPARTVGSAAFAHVWTALWLYFTAPLLGMFGAAEIYIRVFGKHRVLCAKLHPAPSSLCSFVCNSAEHVAEEFTRASKG